MDLDQILIEIEQIIDLSKIPEEININIVNYKHVIEVDHVLSVIPD